MKNKKTKIAIIGVIALVLVTIGLTYAYWLITRTQTKTNVIGAGCLDISLSDEQNDISLTNQFPLSDEEGMELTPYTFTVTNNCNTSVDYQLNLELLGDSTTSIASSSIKVGLNDNSFILGNKEIRETTEENAYTSYQLLYGRLEATGTEGSSDTHNLRLWLDKDAPIEEMNKTLESKVVLRAGQGIENPFEEGTMAFNIVGNAGGSGYVTELGIAMQEGDFAEASDVVVETSKSFYWGTDYTFDSDAGFTLSGTINQATVAECRATEGLCGQYTLQSNVSEADSSATLYKVTSLKDDSANFAGGSLTKVSLQRKGTSNGFSEVTTADYAKLHQTEDDLGTSYYYRGATANNYVKFGKWSDNATEIRGYAYPQTTYYYTYTTLEECQSAKSYNLLCEEVAKEEAGKDMYWRIVRINGDGTIRMIYDGTKVVSNGTSHDATIGKTYFNTNYDNAKYVGYTYENEDGTQTDSTSKGIIDTWYDANLETNYGTYIADSIFCNDRTSRTADDGYTYYGAYDRLLTKRRPQLKCSQITDKYTMNTEYGNGYLTNPVGLITADEVTMAGGMANTSNYTYYLANSNTWYWTSAPDVFNGSHAHVWRVNVDGSIYSDMVNDIDSGSGGGARPVINLKANVNFTGSGTIDSPYEIVMN